MTATLLSMTPPPERNTTMKLNRTYVITGYNPNGSSAYWKRNVAEDCAMEEMNDALDAGWTGMQATPESF